MWEQIRNYWADLAGNLEGSLSNIDLAAVLLGVLAVVVASLILLGLLRLVRFASNGLTRVLQSWEGVRIRALNIQRQELLSAADILMVILWIVKAGRALALVMIYYVYLHFVLTRFTVTRDWAAVFLEHVVDAVTAVVLAVINYLPNLVFIAVVFLFSVYLVKLARLIFNGIDSARITFPGFYQEWAKPTFNLVRFLIVGFSLVVIFPYLPGAGSSAFQGISIFFGVLLSLGSTAAVANVVAGVVITYMRAFQIGDRVKIADTVGDVVEKTLFVTRVRTPKNVDITMPNSMVLANHIINFTTLSQQRGLILHTQLTIGYDVPWREVHDLMIAAAKDIEGIEAKPEPFVLQTSLDDFYVSYELNASTRHAHLMPEIYSKLHQNIQDRFNEAGIEIMSPHYSAVRDGNQKAVPEDYLPRDYEPPAFRFLPFERLLKQDSKSKGQS